jgi:hypothetical protein
MQSEALRPLAKEWLQQIPMGRLAEVSDLQVSYHHATISYICMSQFMPQLEFRHFAWKSIMLSLFCAHSQGFMKYPM